jgi:LacI family transcriptional regulator
MHSPVVYPARYEVAAKVREVAVLVETDTSWGRSVVRGVAEYASNHGPWNLLIDLREASARRWALPETWNGDGLIARISSPLMVEELARRRLPAVNVDDLYEDLPHVGAAITDESARAILALEHLSERGFRQFGYFAPPSQDYSKKRGQRFLEAVRRSGLQAWEYRPGYATGRRLSREEQYRRITRWLMQLPRPVAILAADAPRGRQLVEICGLEGIRVPDEVAILAGDTDDLLCNVCSPPLSSISVASQRIGYDAGALLHRMMEGESPPPRLEIAPLGVVSRQSTDVLAIDDPMIVRALRFIQAHAYQGIIVEDVLREVPVSRRYLELQFKRYLGRLPAEEIRRIRLDRGRELLAQGELSVEEIAAACGYAGATQFGVAFRKRFGRTPLSYRKHLNKG